MAKPTKSRSGAVRTVLGAQKTADPAAWAMKVRTALLRAGGNTTRAAGRLGISHRHLCRWLADHPELRKP